MTDTSTPLVFVPLSSGLRGGLEGSVVEARRIVEFGVGRVFERLGIQRAGDPFGSGVPVGLTDDEKTLRRVVGVKVRAAGGFDAAVEEVAFGVWHRMLFARFLAENDLLMHPEHNTSVSLDECGELAEAGWGADRWVVASQLAAGMLPGLFPVDDPVGRLELQPEDLQKLEVVLVGTPDGKKKGIPSEVFVSDDGLGWVYQFWQSKRKDEVNKAEVKIGARELPAVTQLFTEHYMVRFLLENSLGAWWAARHPDSPLVGAFEYLRFDDDGVPAAGSFEGWPESVAGVTVMDPAAGSGHFLTSLFEMLWRMRVEEEGLDPVEAQDLVLSENLFGLELDPRVTQIAAFNVALAAWKAGGYRELPELNIACSGIRVAGSRDSWLELAGDDPRLRDGLERLHDVFKDADTLGSLIDPRRTLGDESLLAAGWYEIQPLLTEALERETTGDPAAAVFGAQVSAVAKAADLLSRRYALIATNPPFLGSGSHDTTLRESLERNYRAGRFDLATAFLQRGTGGAAATAALVTPQNWLFLTSYVDLRSGVIDAMTVHEVVGLGPGAFETISGEVVQVALCVISEEPSKPGHKIRTTNLRDVSGAEGKAHSLKSAEVVAYEQASLREVPDFRITFVRPSSLPPMSVHVDALAGIQTGDTERFVRLFFETSMEKWLPEVGVVREALPYGGRTEVIDWEEVVDFGVENARYPAAKRTTVRPFRGSEAWNRDGICVSLTGDLSATLYMGERFNNNVAVIVPRDHSLLPALWSYCISGEFGASVRDIDMKLNVTNRTLAKVPFDVEHWRERAAEEFPDGLPEPWSDDPTQWLFLGRPEESTDPLQVAVARLLGYSWPDQEPDELDALADEDGIVCLPSVMGEAPAADRLRELLVVAFAAEDDPVGLVDGMLAEADASGKTLEWWLENRFFKQHHQVFHKRPFIWHITDHHKGGFSALVNYHKLNRAGLERLTFTYLGWWIDAQRAAVAGGVAGADDRLAAAEVLQDKLKLTLEGEPPFDIYARWKTLAEQSIGWDPDLDDGVRLNIRPFVQADVLNIRRSFNEETQLWEIPGIKWGKDRGKNPDGSERLNDLHFTRVDKQAARNNT